MMLLESEDKDVARGESRGFGNGYFPVKLNRSMAYVCIRHCTIER
jgi:hypothetical protein